MKDYICVLKHDANLKAVLQKDFRLEKDGFLPYSLTGEVRGGSRLNASSVGKSSTVTLREITKDTLRPILELRVAEDQQDLVANNAVSIAQAHFADYARFRAIYADEIPVGFIMWSEQPEIPKYFLWRLMIDARFQRFGFGRRAVQILIEHVKSLPGATELIVTAVPADNSPIPFYESLGFRSTGRYQGEELVMRFVFDEVR